MNVIAATLCGYFPVGFHQDLSALHLLVITDLRLLAGAGSAFAGPFMDIRLLPCHDLQAVGGLRSRS